MEHPFPIGSPTGRHGVRSSERSRAWLAKPAAAAALHDPRLGAAPTVGSPWFLVGLFLGLALLSACTVRLELGEHRFVQGDLAAPSMGLVAHERWLGGQPRGVGPTVPPSRRVASRRPGRMPEPDLTGEGGAERSGVRLVTLADNVALAGPDSLARLIASLSGGGAPVAPALGPPEIRLAANRVTYPGLGIPAPRPSPEKPGYSPGATWVPKAKPLAWREQALRRIAPPPPARPEAAKSPGWHLG